MKIIFVFIAN